MRRGGGGNVPTTGRGGTLVGSAGLAMALSKILARSTMACCWASTNWENGATGAGLVRASVRSHAAVMAASTKDFLVTGHLCGNNLTVLAVRSALVLGT